MRGIVAAAAVALFLIGATPADARMLRAQAQLAATADAREKAGKLGTVNTYSTPRCKRLSAGRFSCRVSAAGKTYVGGLGYVRYRHRRCHWTALVRKGVMVLPYFNPHGTVGRRQMRCHAWITH